MPHVILLGTLDTKLEEFRYLYDRLSLAASQSTKTPLKITLIDCGREPATDDRISITHEDLVAQHGDGTALTDLSRGDVIKYMTQCVKRCVSDLVKNENVHGILSAGGSGGSSLASAVMREAAPIGMPKLLVSTVASGDTSPLVGETDITMMYSVVDIAGSNQLLRNILNNAAAAMVGMANAYESLLQEEAQNADRTRMRVGVTMFGVTTPGVDKIRRHLEERHGAEVFVFHATGHGGRAMERLVQDQKLDAVIDLTTTEICDHLMGGNMSAGPERLEAALKAGIPNLISVGATDMVNFGPKVSVPSHYSDRQLLEHNPTVTLMRTTPEEAKKIAHFITNKIKTCAKDPSKVQVWLPKGGVSMIAVPGGPFADSTADEALFQALKDGLKGSGVEIVEDERDINDAGFAVDVAERLVELIRSLEHTTYNVGSV